MVTAEQWLENLKKKIAMTPTCPSWCKYQPRTNDPWDGCQCDDYEADCPLENEELTEDDHYVPTREDYLGI